MLKYTNRRPGYVTFSSFVDLLNSFGISPDEGELYELRCKMKRSKVVDIWHYDDEDAAFRCIDLLRVIRFMTKDESLRHKMYSSYAFSSDYFYALVQLGNEYPSAFNLATIEIENNFGVFFSSSVNSLYNAYSANAKKIDNRVRTVEKLAKGTSIGSKSALGAFRDKVSSPLMKMIIR